MAAEYTHKRLKLDQLDNSLCDLRITRPGEQEKICRSLRLSGQLNPLIVRVTDNISYQILDGFKRYYSAKDLGLNHQDLQSQLVDWLENVNDQRVHRTTKQSPLSLYKQEYPYLQALPAKHYDTSVTGYRVVNNESCIEWRGYFYAVPPGYMHKSCLVREKEDQVIIYGDENNPVVTHSVAAPGSSEKYIGREQKKDSSAPLPKTEELISRLESMGPVMREYIAVLQKHKASSVRHHLLRVLSLKATYQKQDILIAVGRALKYKVYPSGSIESFLSVNAEKKDNLTLFPNKQSSHED